MPPRGVKMPVTSMYLGFIRRMRSFIIISVSYTHLDVYKRQVEWVEPDDMKPNDGVQPEWFYPAIENAEYSEITAILQLSLIHI